MTEVEIIGFAPDADPTTPGVLVDCDAIIPSEKGWRALPGRNLVDNDWNSTVAALPDAEIRGVGAFRQGLFQQVFAGTSEKIFALRFYSPTTAAAQYAGWEDMSRSGGYTLSVSDGMWMFEGFGDYVIAAMGSAFYANAVTLQAASALAVAFADIPDGPAACIVVVASRFVMALNLDGIPDGWKCCARDNHTDWTLSVATGCAQGRLVEAPGPITAAIAFDDDILAFKEDGFWIGRYAGAPEIWVWNKQAVAAGCVGPHAVTKAPDGMVYFVGRAGLFSWDGSVATPLMAGTLQRWWTNLTSPISEGTHTECVYDEPRNIVWIATQAGPADVLLAYHVPTKRWGKTASSTRTWDLIFSLPVNFSDTSAFLFGYAPADRTIGLFDTSHRMCALAGPSASVTGVPTPTFTTGDFGDVSVDTELNAARVKFTSAPDSATCTPMHRAALDATLTTAAAVSRASGTGRFDLWQIDRWHRLRFDLQGDVEFTGYAIDADAVDDL